jgi:hypothetical protein
MRRAGPHELTTRAYPVMTARISEAELEQWLPVPFDDIDDPLAAPEPSKGALVQLEAGSYIVVYYGKDSGQLFVEIPETTKDSSALIADFFREVPLPIARVLWHRSDITLPDQVRKSASIKVSKGHAPGAEDTGRTKRSAKRISLPKPPK